MLLPIMLLPNMFMQRSASPVMSTIALHLLV
jgi:hypothetical protein